MARQTSNRSRDLHDALRRRCLYHWIDYPEPVRAAEIVRRTVPGATTALIEHTTQFVGGARNLDLDKPPGLAETFGLCRTVVVPTLLDAASYLVHKRGLRHFQELGLRVIPVAQRVRTDRKEQRDLLKHFEDGVVLRDRALYANCYGKGLTVASVRGMPHLGLAQSEIERLVRAVDGGGK